MTNGWIDIKNTDMMLIMGGNPAENHPCGFKWPIEAKRQRNAKMIVVDPRFTRTAATADMFLQIRAGSDIAFLGGLINYAIENDRIASEYLVTLHQRGVHYQEGLQAPRRRPVLRLRSGNSGATTIRRWNYEAARPAKRSGSRGQAGDSSGEGSGPSGRAVRQYGAVGKPGVPRRSARNIAYDLSLQHPRCVFQLLKQQYSRYTPEMVERITGIPEGSVSEGRRPVHLHPQGRRHEEGRHHHLRGRLDAAHLRHADHPHRGDAAIAARQRRARRRRSERACAATRIFRAPPTWPASSTSCPAI